MRIQGDFNFSNNFEVKKESTLDARALVPTYADLLLFSEADYVYDEMIVSVQDDPDTEKNGPYRLINKTAPNLEGSWVKLLGDGEVVIKQNLPYDFFISCSIDSSLLNYKTDMYRTFDLQPYMPDETVLITSQIVRLYNDDLCIIANGRYGYITVITLHGCKILDNILTVEKVTYGRVTEDASQSSVPDKYRTHSAVFTNGFVFISTRPDDNATDSILVKVNPYDISDFKRFTFPVSNDSFKYQTTEIRAYKNYIYLLFARGGSNVANMVRVDENLTNAEVVFQLGNVTSLKRIRRESTFVIYNDEIYVPTVNNVSAPNAYNTMGVSVYSMDGTIKRETNLVSIGTGYTQQPFPHWMAIFNGKIIISCQYGYAGGARYIIRFDAQTLAFEEILNTSILITHRNSLFSDGYMYLNGEDNEFNPGTVGEPQLWKVKYNNFNDLTVEIADYNNGKGSYGSIEPLMTTEGLKTKLSQFKNDGDGTSPFVTVSAATAFIPYTGATQNVNLNGKNFSTTGSVTSNIFQSGSLTLSGGTSNGYIKLGGSNQGNLFNYIGDNLEIIPRSNLTLNGTELTLNGGFLKVTGGMLAADNLADQVLVRNTSTNYIGRRLAGGANGFATLGNDIKVPLNQLPVVSAITDGSNYPVSSTAVFSALTSKADLVGGKIPASQLPSFVDDVLEFDTLADFPVTGESGKLYLAKDTNLVYRWGGTEYVATNSSLALGETAETAYRGDRGKIAYDHSQTIGNPHSTQHDDLVNIDSGQYRHLSPSQLTRVLNLIYVNSVSTISVSPSSGERGLSTPLTVNYNMTTNDDIFTSAVINPTNTNVLGQINTGNQSISGGSYVNNVTFTLSLNYTRNGSPTGETKTNSYTSYIPQFAGAASATDYTAYSAMSTDLQKFIQSSASITKSSSPTNQYIWFISNKNNATVLDANNFTQTVGAWGDATTEFWLKSFNLTLADGVSTSTVYLYRSRNTKTLTNFTYKIQ